MVVVVAVVVPVHSQTHHRLGKLTRGFLVHAPRAFIGGCCVLCVRSSDVATEAVRSDMIQVLKQVLFNRCGCAHHHK